MINDLLLPLLASTALSLVVVLIHYEVLRFTSLLLPRLTMPPRRRILIVLVSAFFAHTVEVLLYAMAYFLLSNQLGIGSLAGLLEFQFVDYLYFSASTYTSLGYGDIYPLAGLRLIASIETIVGLMMIGWSASFTYLTMEKFWGLHGPHKW